MVVGVRISRASMSRTSNLVSVSKTKGYDRSAIFTSRTVSDDNNLAECAVRMSPKHAGLDLGQEKVPASPFVILFRLQESSPENEL
ncbi:hypothetical protein TNCV_2279341 [Trichonephila clavipes]|uniref:Uncharacterized protein n=1 Tax=Trichonephila clavipes TaxID=2585209 RepID=A0A8X6R4W6_TRICX|nr:hypothetical protein TNCV_2279341 [Trichonephila clavipes]